MHIAFLSAALLMFAPPSIGHASPDPDSLRVPILVYHSVTPHRPGDSAKQLEFDVSPEAFETQMTYLRDHGITVVSFERLVNALEGHGSLPPRAAVIAFDDGWENQYVHAFPILRQFGYTATFFVFTSPLGRDDRYMTWEQLRDLQNAGMTIGAHTLTHPRLKTLTDPKMLHREVDVSRERLEQHLGSAIAFFAYPFGVPTPDVTAAVQAAGFRAARVFPGGVWHHPGELWSIRSVEVTEPMERFKRIVDPDTSVRHATAGGPHRSATRKTVRS
jgi:peptidoglycan/xylan/chitin deacetylase (PgdA/CDA1 family)